MTRKSVLEAEITSSLRPFYCELCDKQFKTVGQYDEHTNSYAHHHKARFKDMQASTRIKDQAEIDKRKEKERKREEKELRKMALARGVKMPKAAPSATASSTIAPIVTSGVALDKPSDAQDASTLGGGGFKKVGWATVGSSPPPPPPLSNPPLPPPEPEACPPPPPPPLNKPSIHGLGSASISTARSSQLASNAVSSGSWSASLGSHTNLPTSSQGSFTLPQPPGSPPPVPQAQDPAPTPVQPVRSNWQQFQKGGKRKH